MIWVVDWRSPWYKILCAAKEDEQLGPVHLVITMMRKMMMMMMMMMIMLMITMIRMIRMIIVMIIIICIKQGKL